MTGDSNLLSALNFQTREEDGAQISRGTTMELSIYLESGIKQNVFRDSSFPLNINSSSSLSFQVSPFFHSLHQYEVQVTKGTPQKMYRDFMFLIF